MTEITLVVPQVWRDPFVVTPFLIGRFHGRLRPWLMALAGLLGFLGGFYAMALAFGRDSLPPGGASWILPAFVGLLCAIAVEDWNGARLRRAVRSAPFRQRQRDIRITLSEAGLHDGCTLFRWSDIVEIVEFPGALLLLFSPLEYIALPYDSLPSHVSPEGLRTRIDGWRSA